MYRIRRVLHNAIKHSKCCYCDGENMQEEEREESVIYQYGIGIYS